MTKTPTPEAFAATVAATLEAEQRSLAWLAGRAGIAPSTLRYQIHKPSALTLRTAFAVSEVLGVAL